MTYRLITSLTLMAALGLSGPAFAESTQETAPATDTAPLTENLATDDMEALHEKAAQGSAPAQVMLALAYGHGEQGLEQDYGLAVHWARLAATQGDPDGAALMASSYRQGLGVEEDQTKAVKWGLKAADAGSVPEMYNLALAYNQGTGVEQDMKTALHWGVEAAKRGDVDAQIMMARIYRDGESVKQDPVAALAWARQAAVQGVPSEMLEVARGYANSRYARHDPTLAYAAGLISIELGKADPDIKATAVQEVEQEVAQYAAPLSPAERTQAEGLAEEWEIGDPLAWPQQS